MTGGHLVRSRPCPAAGHIATAKKKYMAAVARGIDETRDAVQLNGFFGKKIYFFNLFSQIATLFVSLFVNLQVLSYYFSTLNIFQGFSLNFARTLGCALDKLLNGSRVNSQRQFIFGGQS